MENKTTSRKANIECLRVVAMFMIILQHIGDRSEPLFSQSTLLINELYCNLIRTFGTVGVNCFVLITGYFMINQQFELKKLFRIYLKVFVYGFVTSCFLFIIGYAQYGAFQWVENLFPVLTMKYWYISIYIGLYLIIPFLNDFLKKLEKKEYVKLLFVEIFLFSILSIFTLEEVWVSRFSWFIFLYSLAAYVRLYPGKFQIKPFKCFTVATVVWLMLWLSVQALKFLGNYVSQAESHIYYFTANWYIFDLIISFMLLLGFLNMDFYSKPVLTAGKVSLAVYILHSTVSPFEKIFKISSFLDSYFYIPYTLLCALAVYCVCGIIDITLDKLALNRLSKRLDAIANSISAFSKQKYDSFFEKYL